MVSIFINFYNENCGVYNNVLVQMKGLYNIYRFLPIPLFLIVSSLSFLLDSLVMLCVGLIIFVAVIIFLIRIVNKKAKAIVIDLLSIDQFKGEWNSPIILEELHVIDRQKIKSFLVGKGKDDKDIQRILDKLEKRIDIAKPKFPVIPATIGGLVLAWYSAVTTWLYSMTKDLTEMLYPITVSLIIMGFIIVLYFLIKKFVDTVNDMVFSPEYYRLLTCYNRLEEVLYELQKDE